MAPAKTLQLVAVQTPNVLHLAACPVVVQIPAAAALVLRTAAARPVVVGIPAAAAVVLRTAAVEAAIGQVMTAVAHPLVTRQEAETLPTVLDGVI